MQTAYEPPTVPSAAARRPSAGAPRGSAGRGRLGPTGVWRNAQNLMPPSIPATLVVRVLIVGAMDELAR